MPIYEESFFGLLLSPITLMILLSLVITSALIRVLDRALSFSLKRHESLLSMLLFVIILALLVGKTF
ncbi:DUF1656 domain-containing protein [Pluralibacter gergoviae]|nr:DUF1656 domain-containing protein [Pluralibacter gergoviae]EKV6245246.1 DUF1656 domain-containing protein [Pluralibacter gergoviae]EKW9967862.1 DUF1656 domain-containing protein [Pluralibacter gergoviae]EKZ9515828.1 DUF1656 domain-containing protein [Pluralibacter gergoviae]ELC3017878.1 DUF1656 domain-containing protein [Pluralibacter gergoviae]